MPIHPLPQPLRGAQPGSFAEDTIVNRLPRILRQTMAATAWPPSAADRLAALLAEMPQAPLRPLTDGAVDNEEWKQGLKCVAAPILDYYGKIQGTISISGPSNRLPPQRVEEEVIPTVVAHAGEVSRKMGFLIGKGQQ